MDKKVVYRFYSPATTVSLENWLTEMALDGWILIDMKRLKFTFKKSKPQEIKYFMYSNFDSSKGMSFDYFMAYELYGKSKSKFTLNIKIGSGIFEIDNNKLDSKFYTYTRFRYNFYKKYYISMFLMWFILFMIMLFCGLNEIKVVLLAIPLLTFLIYYLISLILLSKKAGKG